MPGKADPVRPIVKFKKRSCAHCKATFQPSRSDGQYCRNLCKQAAYAMRNKKREEVVTFELKVKRREDALVAIDNLDRFRSAAAVCHQQAENKGIGLRFMATTIGVLAVETVPGALEVASNPLLGHEVKTRSDSPEITALLSQHVLGGSYISQVAERECRKALQGGPADVVLYIHDEDYWFAEFRKQPIQSLPISSAPIWPRSDSLDDEEYDAGPDDSGLRVNDFLMGDGYQVIKP